LEELRCILIKKKELQIYEGHTPRKMLNYIAKKKSRATGAYKTKKEEISEFAWPQRAQ
jgi:hypothetical protein